MKKVLALLMAVICLASILTACSGDTLVSTWTTTIEGVEGQMILNEDGTGEIISHDESRPCVWEVDGDTITVVQHREGIPYTFLDAATYVLKGKTLTITSQSGNTLVFEKE